MRKFQHTFAARRLVNPLCYSLRFDRMMKLPNGHKIKSKIGLRFFRASDLSITLTNNKKPHPEKENLEFGKTATDHMLKVTWNLDAGWGKPEIVPFEGMKAYKADNGKVHLFRPAENMKRFNQSGGRLSFPTFPEDELLALIKKLVATDSDWIPQGRGYSLYIRPTMIGITPTLGVKMAKVGPYFSKGFSPVKLFADNVHVRSHLGGTGAYKLGSNYAGTIQPQQEAAKKGYDQILWLRDGLITEVGQMNLFCLWKTKEGKTQLITAPLDGTILPGIVRKSVLELAHEWNDFEVVEDYYSIAQLGEAIDEGRVMEIFGTGTGAVVCPVAGFEWNNKYYSIANNNQPLNTDFSKKVLKALEKIHYGEISHPWAVEVPIQRE